MDKKTFKQYILIVTYGVGLYLLLTNLSVLTDALQLFRRVFASFLYGLVIAYLLNIPYKLYREKLFVFFNRRGGTLSSASKYVSMLLAYFTVLLILAFLIWIIIPQLVISLTLLIQNIPYYIQSMENMISRIGGYFGQEDFYEGQLNMLWPNLISWSNALMNDVINNFVGYISSLTTHIYNLIIAIAFSVYLLSGKEKLLEQSRRVICAYMSRKKAERFMEISSQTNKIFNNFIAGNVLDSMLVGMICFAGMSLFNFPYPLLISVIIGVTNLIPIVGPFIGAVPGAMIILTVDPIKVIFFVIFIFVLQQVDGNIFKPKIFGNKIGLPSVWILLSIVVLGGLFGIFGMLIGVPVFGVLYALFRDSVRRRSAEKYKNQQHSDEELTIYDTFFEVPETKEEDVEHKSDRKGVNTEDKNPNLLSDEKMSDKKAKDRKDKIDRKTDQQM